MRLASKIWLSLSVLLAGYLLSVSVGYVLNRQIATLSGHAWKYDYPVTMAMEGVVKSHESMWEAYRNAVLLGDPAHSQQALKSAAIVMTDLQALEALQSGVHDHASDLAPVITMFEQLSKDAAVVYPELIVAGDYPSDELQDQVQSVAELKETFARILNDLQVLAAEEFKEQLEEIQRLSMMQARVNLTVFAVVLLISIPLVSVSIRRIILTPFQRILSAVKLDQKPDMSLLPRDEIGDLAGAFAKLYEQQMRSNEDLKESQEHLAATLRSIGDGVVSCDTEARVVGLNVVAEKLTGWTTAEAKGLPVDEVFNIVNAETHKKIENPVVRALRDGAIVGLANHTVLIDRRGQEYQISDSCAPICGAHGGILGCVLVFRDVTEEYRQQTVLRESEERFSRLAEQSRSFTWEVDAAGLYTYVHPVVEMVTGFPPDKIVGQLHFYEQFPEQERETLKQEAFAIFAAQEPFVDFISQIQAKDGEVVSILTNGFPRLNEDGQLVGYQGNSIDITQHQRTEDEKKQLQDQLTQAQKMESVGRLAGGVAHDFNNMLTVILGHVDLALIDLPEDDPLRAHLDDIQQSALRSSDLTRQLLAFARKQTVTPEVLNLNEAVTSMLNMLSRLIGEDIELVWTPCETLERVHLDPGQVNQILANLVVNARDAIGPDGGKVTIKTESLCADHAFCLDHAGAVEGDYVVLSIRDSGCGMEKEIFEDIFEPFFTTKGVGEGTGLGLATVYGIVKQNSGLIDVESSVDQGTQFKIYLPAYKEEEVKEASNEVAPSVVESGQETILLVEDEPAILQMIETLLKRLGYTVIVTEGPEDALRQAETFNGSIDLLLTDVIMPGMNGRDLAKKILSMHPDIRCLFMSGYTADVIANQGIVDNGIHFIQKPFSVKALADKIKESLLGSQG